MTNMTTIRFVCACGKKFEHTLRQRLVGFIEYMRCPKCGEKALVVKEPV